MTHICVDNVTIIGSDNGLSPGRRQAIIWNNDGILLIGPLGTNSSEIVIEIITFSVKKMHLKMSSGNWRPSCPGPNVLICLNGTLHDHVMTWRRSQHYQPFARRIRRSPLDSSNKGPVPWSFHVLYEEVVQQTIEFPVIEDAMTSIWHQCKDNTKTRLIFPSHKPTIYHNATFCNRNVHICPPFCYKMVHCGVYDKCIVGFVGCGTSCHNKNEEKLCVTLFLIWNRHHYTHLSNI